MATSNTDGFGPSPLDMVDKTFRLLVSEPDPLAVDGAQIGHGLPPRPVPLDELRDMLLHPSLTYGARDVIWRALVGMARSDNPAWLVGATGIALPALRQLAGRLAADYDGDCHDLDAEMLTGFVQAIRVIDISTERIAARLCFTAYNAGRRLRHREAAHSGRRSELMESVQPVKPWGHPDFVLARAVSQGLITRVAADLIGRTRLEGEPLSKVAADNGLGYTAGQVQRWRAEQRLAQAIRDGELDDIAAGLAARCCICYAHTTESPAARRWTREQAPLPQEAGLGCRRPVASTAKTRSALWSLHASSSRCHRGASC